MPTINKDSTYTLNNGKTIPINGFGVYEVSPKETEAIIYEALKVGYRHIDSAIYYENEKESIAAISRFLKDYPNVKRSEIFYTTKVNTIEPLPKQDIYNLIKSSYELAKSEIGYIDLFLIHSPYPNKEQRLVTYGLLQDAVEAGWVKSIGISNFGVKHLDELFSWEGLKIKPVINQLELHPWLPRKDLQKYAKDHGFLLEAYSPLTRAQKFQDPELVSIAKKHNVSPAEILLRWSFDQGFIPLAKTVHPDRVATNYKVLDHVKLDDEDKKKLEKPDSYEFFAWDPTTIA